VPSSNSLHPYGFVHAFSFLNKLGSIEMNCRGPEASAALVLTPSSKTILIGWFRIVLIYHGLNIHRIPRLIVNTEFINQAGKESCRIESFAGADIQATI